MPLALPRYPGPKLRLKFITTAVFTPWISFNVDETESDDDVTSGGSEVLQRVSDLKDSGIDLTFFNSSDFNSSNIIVGVAPLAIEVASAESLNPSLLDPNFFVKYPLAAWRINKKTLKQDRKSGQVTINMAPNYLDLTIA